MVNKLETLKEIKLEVCKSLTALKRNRYMSRKYTNESRYIKAYKREFEIQQELKWLANFINNHQSAVQEEIDQFSEKRAVCMLKNRCEQINNVFQEDNLEDEDFGDE
ncbi:hypothetical protein ENBRE01_1542 [Enteropsectra breve]|nr:hypothetical protein ENBRE01_1542 [Enteropsectra breve]